MKPSVNVCLAGVFLMLLLFLWGCNHNSQESSTANKPITSADEPQEEDLPDPEAILEKGIASRTAPGAEQLLKGFPVLTNLCREDTAALRLIGFVAQQIKYPQSDVSSEALYELLELIDREVAPKLEPHMPDDLSYGTQEKATQLIDELSTIGLSYLTTEGMFFGLGPESVAEEAIGQTGDEALKTYADFRVAYGQSLGGEYPYTNMEPYMKMVLLGEKLVFDLPPSPGKLKCEERFREALHRFTEVFELQEKGYTPVIVGTYTDYHELAVSEKETLKKFVKVNKESRYQPVIKQLVASISGTSPKPETLFLLVMDWESSEMLARQRCWEYLDAGLDVPSVMPVKRGNGEFSYGTIARFYEDEQKAIDFFTQAGKRLKGLKLVRATVRRGELFEMGI
ncbi:MAG: hypothetical protein AAGI38_22860 [Bacteroidota bacterium]